jgi:hypothetical protein
MNISQEHQPHLARVDATSSHHRYPQPIDLAVKQLNKDRYLNKYIFGKFVYLSDMSNRMQRCGCEVGMTRPTNGSSNNRWLVQRWGGTRWLDWIRGGGSRCLDWIWGGGVGMDGSLVSGSTLLIHMLLMCQRPRTDPYGSRSA